MRTTLIVLLALGTLAACDKERVPEELPAAKIAPEKPDPEAEKTPEAPTESVAGDSKGVGAAGCESEECKVACDGQEQPECAEAFAQGCFTDQPPADKGCEKFVRKPNLRIGDAKPESDPQPAKKKKASPDKDTLDAKATPIGD